MAKKRKSVKLISAAGVVPQLQEALHRADSIIGALAATATETVESLQSQASFAIKGLHGSLDGLAEGTFDGVQDAAKATINFVRNHPWQSAAVVVGVGVAAVAMREASSRLH